MKENINLYKFDELDSTNDYLRRNHKSHEEFDVISARTQTHGKARRQNDWVSMDGMAIFSFFLKERDDWEIENYLKLPLIAGLATINGLKKIENLEYKFKWTNDVFFNSKKLCGILIERVKDDFVVGIGINVANKIPEDIKNIAISLESDYDIDKLILKVVEEFSLYYEKFMSGKWLEIVEEINRNNFLKDKKIRVHIGEQIFEGIAKNIAEDGRLEIEMNSEIKLFSVGEITIEKDYY